MALFQARRFAEEVTEEIDVSGMLNAMVADAAFATPSSYSSNSEQYPDNQMPFTDKHLKYLKDHPKTDPAKYLANIRLMTRVR